MKKRKIERKTERIDGGRGERGESGPHCEHFSILLEKKNLVQSPKGTWA